MVHGIHSWAIHVCLYSGYLGLRRHIAWVLDVLDTSFPGFERGCYCRKLQHPELTTYPSGHSLSATGGVGGPVQPGSSGIGVVSDCP